MPHDTLLCLDIETVPDRDLVPPDWPEDKFITKAIWHRVVAVSFVQARIERAGPRERYRVECCRSGGQACYDERCILQAFWRFFTKLHPRLVTWNGKGFDLPVLRLRAMMYGLSAAAWFTRGTRWDSYTQRYAPGWHCDLMEQLSDYGACARLGLEDVAVALGLPGKIGGHGGEIAAMVDRGEIERVRAYCECDCLCLFVLYLRWALLSGRVDAAGYNASLDSLLACLHRDRAARPHFGEFLDSWQASERPVPRYVPAPGLCPPSQA